MKKKYYNEISRIRNLYIFSMLFCFLGYYLCKFVFSNKPYIRNVSGRILGLIALVFTEIAFIYAVDRTKHNNRAFWKFAIMCGFFYIIAECSWIYYIITGIYNRIFPFNLGGTEVIYIFSSIIAMISIVYFIFKHKRDILNLRFIIDFVTIIIVLASIMWDYILSNLSYTLNIETYAAGIFGLYLLCNIPLFIAALNFLIDFKYFNNKAVYSLLVGSTLLMFLNLYSILINSYEIYSVNSLVDPIWILAFQFIGLSSLYDIDNKYENINMNSKIFYILKNISSILPYGCIVLLLIVNLLRTNKIDFLTIGFMMTVVIVIIRQIITIMENKRLLKLLYKSYEELENKQKVLEKKQESLEKLNLENEKQANTDYLTGLPNRRFLTQKGIKILETCKKQNKNFSIFILDIDDFKSVNDTYGHDFGDKALKLTAKIAKEILKDQLVGRIGGEEFAGFIIGEKDKAIEILENLRKEISKNKIRYNKDTNIQITVSIGFSMNVFNKDKSINTIILRADEALYKCKKQGKNCVAFKE